jgi:hypothetical protein
LAVAAVGLLGLAVWEVLGAGRSQPPVGAAQRGEDEPTLDEEPALDVGGRGAPRRVRERPRWQVEAATEETGTATEEEPRPQEEPGRDDVTGQAPTLEEAREGFAHVMEELASVGERRRRISQEQWERHYREANDAFAALSARLRAGNEKERAELEKAHELLKERLGSLRVRGKKHEAP